MLLLDSTEFGNFSNLLPWKELFDGEPVEKSCREFRGDALLLTNFKNGLCLNSSQLLNLISSKFFSFCDLRVECAVRKQNGVFCSPFVHFNIESVKTLKLETNLKYKVS